MWKEYRKSMRNATIQSKFQAACHEPVKRVHSSVKQTARESDIIFDIPI
jgi:hypothetical protein